jgi:succinyl-diaminopimelate desuccinylase
MTPKEQILAWVENDRDELVRFLSNFVAIPTPNPPGDTREAARFLADRLRAENAPVEIRSAKDHLPNVVGSFEGARSGPHLVLNGHIDVFPVGPSEPWTRDPWSGAVEDGKAMAAARST